MNKNDLVVKVAENLELTKAEVEEVVDAVFETLKNTLAAGEDVKLTGFGNFVVKTRAAREGTNPATGARITIPASKTVAFKPAKNVKEAL